MSTITANNIIAALLMLAVVVFGVALLVYYAGPLEKTLRSLFWAEDNTPASEGIGPFNQFVNEYRDCKLTPDTDCLCPLTPFALPKNSFIEIDNYKGSTAFNYHQGDVHSNLVGKTEYTSEKILDGCKPLQNCFASDSQYTIENDRLLIPRTTPGAGSSSGYLTDKCTEYEEIASPFTQGSTRYGEKLSPPETIKQCKSTARALDTSKYLKDSKIFIAYFKSSFFSAETQSSAGGEAYATPMEVYTTADLRGSDQFNLQALYKKDNNLYFVPTSNSLMPFYRQEKANIAELRTIKQCKKLEGIEPALKTFSDLKQATEKCSKINVLSFKSCEVVKVDLPKDYSITISANNNPYTYSLWYNTQLITTYIIKKGTVSFLSEQKPVIDTKRITETISSAETNPKTAVVQIDVNSCPKNTACILPRYISQEQTSTSSNSLQRQVAAQIVNG